MQPIQLLLRFCASLIIAQAISYLVRHGVLVAEQGEQLSPLVTDVLDFYLPFFLTAVFGAAHQIYAAVIQNRLFDAAREMPPATAREVSQQVLGTGKKRKAAKFLLGVK